MGRARNEIAAILDANGGVIARRDHPDLTESLTWLVRCGTLRAVFPGVYCAAGATDRRVLIRAAMLWAPDAVLTGPAAASVSFWPQIRVPIIDLSTTRQHRVQPKGFQLARRSIPADLIEARRGLRFTAPALTALDLCDSCGGDGIDTALRTRAATLDGMRAALELTRHRAGNTERRRFLLDSRDEPWSAAERLCHRLLHDAGIKGWRGNVAVPSLGSIYYVDIAFERQMLAIEIDGRLHEDDPDMFESDRWRQNHLVLQGWRVLRFTWLMLTAHPDLVVQTVTAALNPKTSLQFGDA